MPRRGEFDAIHRMFNEHALAMDGQLSWFMEKKYIYIYMVEGTLYRFASQYDSVALCDAWLWEGGRVRSPYPAMITPYIILYHTL